MKLTPITLKNVYCFFLFILLFFIPFLLVGQITYAERVGTGDGSSGSSTLELQAAMNASVAGDTIYFRGTFGGQVTNVEYTMSNAGTDGNPIVLMGRTSTWGEVVNNNKYSSLIPDDTDFANLDPNTVVPTDGVSIPYLEGFRYASRNAFGIGTPTDHCGDGTGINITGAWVELHNIAIYGYGSGVEMLGTNGVGNNITTFKTGEFDRATSYDLCNPTNDFAIAPSCPLASANYYGYGINHYGNGGSLSHCVVINAGAEGIRYTSDNSVNRNNLVFDKDSVNSVDYPYQTSFLDNGLIEDSEVYFHADNRPHGHGFSFKWDNTNTTARRIKCTNNRMEMQYQGVVDNVMEDFEVINGGIYFANGARNNVFRNGTVTNPGSSASGFENWFEDGDHGAVDNTFENITFSDSESGIYFSVFASTETDPTVDNSYIGCTFIDMDYLLSVNRSNSGTLLENCILENITEYYKPAFSVVWPVDLTFTNNTFTNLGFTPVSCGGGLAPCVDLETSTNIVRVYNHLESKKKHLKFKKQ